MPFTRTQEGRWRTTVLRLFPPPLPKVREQHDAGTAVGPRTDIQEPEQRVVAAGREALRCDLNPSATGAELPLL